MRKVLVACIVLLIACSVFAGVEQGAVEVGGLGTYVTMVGDNAADFSMWMVTLYGGYFLTDMIEIKGTLSAFGGEGMDVSGTVGLGADLFLAPSAAMCPYFGASAQMDLSENGNNSTDDMLIEGHGGVKYFLSEATSVNLEARYSTTIDAMADGGMLMGLVGLSVYL